MSRITKTIMVCLAMLWASIAMADPMGPQFQHEKIDQKELNPHYEFTPDEGMAQVQTTRINEQQRKNKEAEFNTEYCFKLMHEAVEDGQCSESFFAEDAACGGAEPTGCFENQHFRRKLNRLGFKVRSKEMPTPDQEDHCAAITVSWCRDLRRR